MQSISDKIWCKEGFLVHFLAGLSLLLISAFSADSRGDDEISIIDAYLLAREYEPALAFARYQVDIAESQQDQAFSEFLPQVNLFGQWSENEIRYDDAVLFPDRDYPGARYGVQVSQSLVNVANVMENRRLEFLVDEKQGLLIAAEATLLQELVGAFFSVLKADEEVDLLETELAAVSMQLEEATALYDSNLIPITQLLETETRLASLEADLVMAQGAASTSRENFIAFTGRRELEPMPIKKRLTSLNQYSTPEMAATTAIGNSPLVLAARSALDAEKRGVDREQSRWIPEVNLSVNVQHSDVGFDNTSSPPRDTSSVAIGFNYPLFEGGAGSARRRAAWARYHAAKTQLLAQERAAETRARSAWLNLEAQAKRLIAAENAVKTSKTNVDASQKAVKLGTARLTDALFALAQNTRAERDYVAAKFNHAMAWLELELSTGNDPAVLAPQISEALH